MSNSYKRLAALRPADTNETALYLAPADTEIIATITICNQSNTERTYRIAHCDTTGAASGEDWLAYDKVIPANDTHQITGISVGAAEEIRVKSSIADLISFVLSGMEIT